MKKLLFGVFVGLLLPLFTDWVLFGDITPCYTVQKFEDGSTVQNCSVRG